MKALIVTVAGMSARFSRSAGEQIIKCLYHTNSMKESLLYTLLDDSSDIDYFIIVGGYRYEELCKNSSGNILKNFQIRFLWSKIHTINVMVQDIVFI